MAEQTGWIGVDLDGTLARYDGWIGPDHIGEPIPIMLERVKQWIADGIIVKIFTARCGIPEQVAPIAAWLEKYGIGGLEITNVKDFSMMELWDDRAVRVVTNTGHPCCHQDVEKSILDVIMGTLEMRRASADEHSKSQALESLIGPEGKRVGSAERAIRWSLNEKVWSEAMDIVKRFYRSPRG